MLICYKKQEVIFIEKVNVEEYIGKKYGRLTVLRYVEMDKWGCRRFEVQCDCEKGTIFSTVLNSLKNGNTQSCGCLRNKDKKKYNTYNLTGEHGIGYTGKNEPFYFDLEDYDKIKDICWHTMKKGYIIGWNKDKRILMHNLIMNSLRVDHIYHNTNDNRKENLRVVTNQQNAFNKKGVGYMSKFGLKGISWSKTGKRWDCQLKKDYKTIHRKYFYNITDAITSQIEIEKIHFGEYRYAWEETIKWEELLAYEKQIKGEIDDNREIINA